MSDKDPMNVGDDTGDSLYPALFQCFTIIICGYVAGAAKMVSQTEAKGIATFVGTFALPSLIFLSLAKLDFSTVNWLFLGAILLAKGIIFFSVIIVTLMISKPTNLGRAGIFAIFCTQSNDFALGYPIINAIYEKTHPEYSLYLYLMAPISLAILNPVAFILMEIHKQRTNSVSLTESQRAQDVCKLKLIRQIVKGIAFNPMLVMTVLGILGNVLFKHQLSIYIEGLLEVFGQAFSATALFLLGLRMVGQIHRLRGPALLLPSVLIMVKLVILPVVMRETVSGLNAGSDETDTLSLSTYAFLYGTIPTAPAVFVFSNLYNLEMDLVASSMVVCTLLSAPIMFMSAEVMSISKDYADQIRQFGFGVSIASLIAIVWCLIVFIITKKYQRMPHRITTCLLLSQLLLAITVIIGGRGPVVSPFWGTVVLQAARIFAMYSCLLWTSMLALALLMFETRGPCFVALLWPLQCFVCWGAPAAAVAVLLLANDRGYPLDGRATDAVRLCVLVFALTVSTGCLILYMRFRRRRSRLASLSADVSAGGAEDREQLVDDAELPSQTEPLNNSGLGYGTIAPASPKRNGIECCTNDPNCSDMAAASDIEDIPAKDECCAGSVSCAAACSYARGVERGAAELGLLSAETSRGRGGQTLRHTVLLVTYCLTMFIGITYTTWSIMLRDESGIFVEIEFLDVAANYGQGLVILALFGFNFDEVLRPAIRAIKLKWFGTDSVILPPIDDLSFETKHVCEQFITHHLDRCKEAIAKDKRWRMRTYKNVFRGSCLVRWLVNCGLAKDAQEAVEYGRHLVDGRLISHINNAHHFTDSPLLYTFN